MKVTENDVGKFILVKYTDAGIITQIITQVRKGRVSVIKPYLEGNTDIVHFNSILKIGKFAPAIECSDTGLE